MFDNTKKYRDAGGPGGAEGKTKFNQIAELARVKFEHPDEDFAICAALAVLWLALRDHGIRADNGQTLQTGGKKLGGGVRMEALRAAINNAGNLQILGEKVESAIRHMGFDKDQQIYSQLYVIARACDLMIKRVTTVRSADAATVMTQILPHGAYLLDYEYGHPYSHTIACYSTTNNFYIFDPNCGEMRCPRDEAYQMWADYWEDVGETGEVSDVRVHVVYGDRTGVRLLQEAAQPPSEDFTKLLALQVRQALFTA